MARPNIRSSRIGSMSAPLLIWLKVNPKSFVPTETDIDRQERLARERG